MRAWVDNQKEVGYVVCWLENRTNTPLRNFGQYQSAAFEFRDWLNRCTDERLPRWIRLWADNHPDINMVAALAYEAGHNDAINEACEWLEQNAYHYCDDIDTLHESALIGDFEYTMKGGKQ